VRPASRGAGGEAFAALSVDLASQLSGKRVVNHPISESVSQLLRVLRRALSRRTAHSGIVYLLETIIAKRDDFNERVTKTSIGCECLWG
jgi:hypothetical protein